MTITPAQVKSRFPEFITTCEIRVQSLIDETYRRLNMGYFGGKADDAAIFMVAHFLSLHESGSGAASGPATTVKVGPLSRTTSFVPDLFKKNLLGTTAYGRMYLDLRSTLIGRRCS